MRKMGRGLVVVVGLALCWAGQAGAKPKKNTCEANLATCTTDLTTANANLASCTTDLTTANADLATCTADLSACNAALAAAQQFPATGQTTCWNSTGTVITCSGTGQDGDIKAGAALSYTDNGNGTITDNNTGLMWAKKSADGTIQDQDTQYTWANAFAVHIAGLNTAVFAGYIDWRLPNVKELQSIVNYENISPAVSPEFNNSCAAACTVVNCSCTRASSYWASSSYANNHAQAWLVGFDGGNVFVFNKSGPSASDFVRAVRGGL